MKDACAALRRSDGYVRRLVRTGVIRGTKIQAAHQAEWDVEEESILEFIAARKKAEARPKWKATAAAIQRASAPVKAPSSPVEPPLPQDAPSCANKRPSGDKTAKERLCEIGREHWTRDHLEMARAIAADSHLGLLSEKTLLRHLGMRQAGRCRG